MVNIPIRVLMVEDSQDDANQIAHELRQGGYEIASRQVHTLEALRAALTSQAWDLILCDHSLPNFDSLDALEVVKASGLDLPFIIVSGAIPRDLALTAMRRGARDFVVKDDLARLAPIVERELRDAEMRRERYRAEAQVRRNAAHAEALARTAARLNAQLDFDAVLQAVCEETVHALSVSGVSISIYDPVSTEIRLALAYGLPAAYAQSHQPVLRAEYEEYFRRFGPVVVVPDARVETTLPSAGLYARYDIGTIVCTGLLRGGELVGLLSVYMLGETRTFAADELTLLKSLADQAAQAIANARLFAEARRRLAHVQALRAIDTAITASLDVRLTLNVILGQVTQELGVDAADVLLLTPHAQVFEYAAGRGFRTQVLQRTRLRLGEGHAGLAALERRVVSVPRLGEQPGDFTRAPLLQNENFVAYFAAPLVAKGHVKGVLEVFHRAPLNPEPEWLDFLETLAGQAAIAIDNAALFENLQRSNTELSLAYDETIEGWSRALDLRDKETEGHTQRVTEMTMRLAQASGAFSEAELTHIRRGALLHDIGKMGVPDGILLKPGPLTESEWEVMRQHPKHAYDMLAPIAFLRPALDIPYSHHEKWEGTGYPRGLRGEAIPLAARLFAVVDVWDALRSDRPYRPGWAAAKVGEHIREQAGKHFDPRAMEMFLGMMGREVE